MPEPMTADYLRTTQQIITAVPAGPWEPVPNDYGIPDAIGPISYLECFDADPVPVIEFVRHAREALPKYVGEVDRLRGENDYLKSRISQLEKAKGGVRHGR